jgi:hypothetical protein
MTFQPYNFIIILLAEMALDVPGPKVKKLFNRASVQMRNNESVFSTWKTMTCWRPQLVSLLAAPRRKIVHVIKVSRFWFVWGERPTDVELYILPLLWVARGNGDDAMDLSYEVMADSA